LADQEPAPEVEQVDGLPVRLADDPLGVGHEVGVGRVLEQVLVARPFLLLGPSPGPDRVILPLPLLPGDPQLLDAVDQGREPDAEGAGIGQATRAVARHPVLNRPDLLGECVQVHRSPSAGKWYIRRVRDHAAGWVSEAQPTIWKRLWWVALR